ncbi:hypothetical protein TWF569_006971 [Orbilia oligospora]|uniref:Major facilitator superfamily (MFS) profile domain-containing protein n=1 Tax=Orbilia oligospora TaxID=2813651 RepID=A0A7C8NL39_ORBOL|nr:hypothetical protein TWF102_011931 [Orbilia oligospora]KAF3110128.1 hypothetical protein TWF706_000866 [Orbilia oligospora]KAF3117578.1 hypothetical protein TWF103_006303 [Orbilia oligospora]KAF3128590.1 hypothetical protein TWF703_009340 [Orbilia oligospora]KAF3144772.1 hypothetical protein TWF569_006971 [Orbilia oligospora]
MGLEGSEKPASSVPETTEVKHTDSTTTTTATTPKQEPLDSKDESGLSVPAERAAPASRADSEKTAVREEQEEAVEKREDETPITTDEKATDSTKGDLDDESKYPGGATLAVLTIGLCLSTFVIALDNSIIATAIPRITSQFNSIGDVGWYGSSYLLTQTSLQPSFGKIYTYFSVKWTFLFSLFIFEVGSIVCAAAPSSTAFIVGRAVAGIGAAALFSGGMTIIGFTVPLRKRPMYIAALSSMFGISSVIGPLLGGAFTDAEKLTWRWCFWINLPIGGVAFAVVLFFFRPPERKITNLTVRERIAKIDILGAFFLISAIVCLLLALQWGGFSYPWSDSRVWGCILGFGLIIGVFIYIQYREQDLATIPPRIFLRNRTVLSACTFNSFLSMALYAHIYFLPFYFQAVRGTSAVQSGIRCIPYLISVTVASLIVGASVTIIGYYTPFMWASAAIFTVGAGLLYTLEVDSPSSKWIGYQIIAGFGAGMGIQIPFVAVQVVLSPDDMPVGNALAIFFNSLGGAISISVAQNIFSNTLLQQLPKLAPKVNPQLVVHAGATAIRVIISAENLPGVILAYNKAITTCFILPIAVGGVAWLCSLGMEMKSVKGKKIELGGGA